jgi:hypothetical protein
VTNEPSLHQPKLASKADEKAPPRKPVVGLEAEFNLFVREQKRKPEHVFLNPQKIVREQMLRRPGRSYHLPSGGAIYFDTGVIEVATPIIELEHGCCIRAGRSLWEQIEFLRGELSAWEEKSGSRVRLQGFSAHYNVSIPLDRDFDGSALRRFGLLLAYLLPVPAMLLTANRLSTGIGVRPRRERIEVTADFTPDPDLMMAAASLIIGIALGVRHWPDHSLRELERRSIPIIAGFSPRKHTSRKGWLARFDCFPRNPFVSDVNSPDWILRDGRRMSLRGIAQEIAAPFRSYVREVGDEDSCEHAYAVLGGRARSLLDFPERPPRYDDVGRHIDWNRRTMRALPRSAYEQVVHRVITGRKLRIGADVYVPERIQGWYEISFRNARTGLRRVFNLDDLVRHCRVT